LDLEAKFLLIKMRFLADIRFVPVFGKPNVIKIEQVSGFNNPNYKTIKLTLLGAFVKLRMATISFVMSVSPCVCPSAWNNLAPSRRIFVKFGLWAIFEQLSGKFKFK
jgi:hypothetical protein